MEYFLSLTPSQGGFTEGYASAYNGTGIVSRSVGLNAPIIYVSFNYRLNGTSFFFNILVKWFIAYMMQCLVSLEARKCNRLASATSGCTIVSIYSPEKI